jgi:uncharacterized protein (TIGR03435 family)
MKPLALIGIFVASAVLATAQQPAFEVASIKPSPPGRNGVNGGCHGIDSKFGPDETVPPLGRCVITDARLSHLIARAWQLNTMSQLKNPQDWVYLGDERFDIQAKTENPEKTTESQLYAMLQALIVDRFQLKFHREDKDLPGFTLVVAKNGPKLQPSKSDTTSVSLGPNGKPHPGDPSMLNTRRYSMALLAQFLSGFGPGPVKDETGLPGDYDFKLNWDETNGPSLFTALQEQLGLRLESRKVPVSFFVIDSAQRPKEN